MFILFLETKRLPRATETQESSRLNQRLFSLPDADGRRERDAWDTAMRAAMAAEREDKPVPDGNPKADQMKNRVLFDYDPYAQVELWWTVKGGQRRIEALAIDDRPAWRFFADWGLKPRVITITFTLISIAAALYKLPFECMSVY